MNSYIKYIGIIDKENKVHSVAFTKGVNVITGKSSTGKSAMIEIFDYCFGSSEFTIPSGVITDNANIYFVVIGINSTNLILARKEFSNYVFIKEETTFDNINSLSNEYFQDKYFIPLKDFKQVLGKNFGLNIKDTDEDEEDRKFRGRAKERPSIRNITPFLLQHQNLVANKHSIFYRFDEKEKREQTIDQFKIFCGFVDQEYFLIKQKLAEEERNLKRLEKEKEFATNKHNFNVKNLESLLEEFFVLSGTKLFNSDANTLLLSPAKALDDLSEVEIKPNYESDESLVKLNQLKKDNNQLESEKRELFVKLSDINSSIQYANDYKKHLDSLDNNGRIDVHVSECPFCKNKNEEIIQEGNALLDAVNWLNDELAKTPYMLESFEVEQKKTEEEIKSLGIKILENNKEIKKIEEVSKKLKRNRSLDEQSLKVKLKIENFLENILQNGLSDIDRRIRKVKREIGRLNIELKEKFDVDLKMKKARNYINKTMKEIGKNFDFEKSYQPINLKFSLESFDLWHQDERLDQDIYLRSMGSGANWLYSHLTLFMSLHKYFCSLGNKSKIPPILFLDQPSQVYFPTVIKDEEKVFDAKKIEEKKGSNNLDEDIKSVTNLFNQLVSFCKTTLEETGIEPQIIVTDHADNLELNDVEFEELVNGRRWRKRGFILQDKINN